MLLEKGDEVVIQNGDILKIEEILMRHISGVEVQTVFVSKCRKVFSYSDIQGVKLKFEMGTENGK